MIDEALAGQKVHNTAVVDSSEKIPATGEKRQRYTVRFWKL